jgi:long-chain-fatty-acid--CoA ligase ACSBG
MCELMLWFCAQMVWSARNAGTQARLTEANEVFVSYLPLSHVAAQILDIFVPLIHGVTVYFAQPDALKVVTSKTTQLTLSVLVYLGVCSLLGLHSIPFND